MKKYVEEFLSAHYPGKLAINQKIKNSYCLSDLYIHKSYRQLSNLKNLYLSCLKNTNGVIFSPPVMRILKNFIQNFEKEDFFNLFSCGLPLTVKPLKRFNSF